MDPSGYSAKGNAQGRGRNAGCRPFQRIGGYRGVALPRRAPLATYDPAPSRPESRRRQKRLAASVPGWLGRLRWLRRPGPIAAAAIRGVTGTREIQRKDDGCNPSRLEHCASRSRNLALFPSDNVQGRILRPRATILDVLACHLTLSWLTARLEAPLDSAVNATEQAAGCQPAEFDLQMRGVVYRRHATSRSRSPSDRLPSIR
jgi:hypothetical protein